MVAVGVVVAVVVGVAVAVGVGGEVTMNRCPKCQGCVVWDGEEPRCINCGWRAPLPQQPEKQEVEA